MAIESILVISERSETADRLRELLDHNGIASRLADPAHLADTADTPDLVLADAAVDQAVVRDAARLISSRARRSTMVVRFDAGDVATADVRSIVDFLTPSAVRRQDVMAMLSRYQREFRTGRETQAGFLPEVLPDRSGWQIAARFQPAGGVSGDFYDVFEVVGGKRIVLVVADVCDKGIGSALYMALIRSLLRYTAVAFGTEQAPGADAEWLLRAIDATNEYLIANHLQHGYFATLFFAVLDPATGTLTFSNCGHNPPVLRSVDGRYLLLGPTGPALGLLPDSRFELDRTQLNHGDLLFVYTDGVTDARDEQGRVFSEERLLALVGRHSTGTEDLLDLLDREIAGHVGIAERFDDITMVALRRQHLPAGGPDSANS